MVSIPNITLVRGSFGKLHALIRVLIRLVKLIRVLIRLVKFQSMSSEVCIIPSTNLASYLGSSFGMLDSKGIAANLHSLPFNF